MRIKFICIVFAMSALALHSCMERTERTEDHVPTYNDTIVESGDTLTDTIRTDTIAPPITP